MTGEMAWVNPETGEDSNGDEWGTHAAIAKAIGGELRPFDAYQGPYIVVGADIRIGRQPYAVAPLGLGVVRLWLCTDGDGTGTVYREDTDMQSAPFPCFDTDAAIEAARELLPEWG